MKLHLGRGRNGSNGAPIRSQQLFSRDNSNRQSQKWRTTCPKLAHRTSSPCQTAETAIPLHVLWRRNVTIGASSAKQFQHRGSHRLEQQCTTRMNPIENATTSPHVVASTWFRPWPLLWSTVRENSGFRATSDLHREDHESRLPCRPTNSGQVRHFLRRASAVATPWVAAPLLAVPSARKCTDHCRVHRQLGTSEKRQPVGNHFEPPVVFNIGSDKVQVTH